jgi:lipopolysaccharide transport system permease protein
MRVVTVYEPPSIRSLRPVAAITRLRQFSQLIRVLTIHRLRVRYARTHLGYVWALLQPLSFMLVFTLMFSLLGRSPGGDVPYPLFAYAALVPWTAFASGVSTATASLTSHANLLTKVAFPREILPITYVIAALTDMAIASTALLALAAWYGVSLTAAVLWVLPAIAVMMTFLTAISLLLAALHVGHRDIGIAVPIVLQIWMFLTPVIYPLGVVQAALSPGLYRLYTLNPMVAVVDTFRHATVLESTPDLGPLVMAAAVSFVLLPLAYVYFKFVETTMADVV